MSYMALYRKWRPVSFEDVKGQDPVVQTLKNQITSDRIGHAYLFCGTRGTGKTSIAKIYARAVNCEHPIDGSPCNQCASCRAILEGSSMNVVEIDAASNNGVENIRDIREQDVYKRQALNYVLSQNGIDPVRDVIIEWKSEPAECLAALTAQENSIAMLPQPFVTTAQSKSDRIRVALDLTEEWNKLQADSVDPSALVTGVVVARTAFVKEHPEAVSDFLDCCQTSVEYVNSNIDEAAKMMDSYGIVASEVAQKAIPSCNIVFIEGSEMKEKLSGYLSVLFEQNVKSVGGTLPDDDFYYKR